MSCVVGLHYNGKIYMASDGVSTLVTGEHRPVICEKMFWNEDYLIGFTGNIRTGQLIKPHYFSPPNDIMDLPDAMYDHLSGRGVLGQDDDGSTMQQSNFLIAWKGKLYDILMDFQLNETYGDFNAIGSGAYAALGSLYTSKRFKSPERRVMTALEAAASFSFGVGKPFFLEVME